MQERKNKRLAILLAVLLAATASVFWFSSGSDNFAVDKEIFRDVDLKSVSEVTLESGERKVRLKFNGSRWRVDDQFDADGNMINVLFATLKQAEPKRPVATSKQDSTANALRTTGVKVTLLSGGELVKSFFAGGNPEKTQAYFSRDTGSETYLMTIPGYRVYVSGIFELPAQGWRDRVVFNFNWRNFASLEAHFPKKPTDDFKVALIDNFFGIEGIAESDTTKLNNFLDDVSLLTVNEFSEATPALDSLKKQPPVISLIVRDISKKEHRLDFFPPKKGAQQIPGLIDGTQWALFQPDRVGLLIKPRQFFQK